MCEVWGKRIKKMEKGNKWGRDLTVGTTVWERGKTWNTHICSEWDLTDLEPRFLSVSPNLMSCVTAEGAEELCKATWAEPAAITSRYIALCPNLYQDLCGCKGFLRQPSSLRLLAYSMQQYVCWGRFPCFWSFLQWQERQIFCFLFKVELQKPPSERMAGCAGSTGMG